MNRNEICPIMKMNPTITFQDKSLLGVGFFLEMMYPDARKPQMTPNIVNGPGDEMF